jgi:hypothetical protein
MTATDDDRGGTSGGDDAEGMAAAGASATGTSCGAGSGALTAGSRPASDAILVNWPGVTVFRLRN